MYTRAINRLQKYSSVDTPLLIVFAQKCKHFYVQSMPSYRSVNSNAKVCGVIFEYNIYIFVYNNNDIEKESEKV